MKVLDSKYFKYILLFFFIFTVFWSGWMMRLAMQTLKHTTGSSEMLDIKPGTNIDKVYSYLDQVGNNGRNVLVSIYKFEDFIFPMAYGPFLFLAIAYFFHKSFPQKKWLLLLSIIPVLGVCFDYIENFSIIHVIKVYPSRVPSIAGIIGNITLVKWILAGMSGFLMMGSFALLVRRYLQHQGDK